VRTARGLLKGDLKIMFFYRNPLKWVQNLEISASSAWNPEQIRFGYSISADPNAELLGISIYPPNGVRDKVPNEFYLFSQQEDGQYVQQQVLRPSGLSIAESHNFGTDYVGSDVIYGVNKSIIAVKGVGFEDRGAVAIFRSGSTGYVQEQVLIDEDENTSSFSGFGYQTVLSNDSSLLLVSNLGNDDDGINAGKIYLYRDISGSFQKIQELPRPPNCDVLFGQGECIFTEDANTLFVADLYYSTDGGTTRPGAVHIYESGSSGYQLVETIEDIETGFQNFGDSFSYSRQSKDLAIGNISVDWSVRKVKIFQSGSNGYQLSQTLGDATVSYQRAQFSYDGEKLFLNKKDENGNILSVFVDSGSGYIEAEQISLPAGVSFFSVKTVNENGSKVIFSDYNDDTLATNAGAAYVYESGSNGWTQSQKILPEDDWSPSHDGFGYALLSANEGETLIVSQNMMWTSGSSPNNFTENADSVGGSYYVFKKQGDGYEQIQRITNPAIPTTVKGETYGYHVASNQSGTRLALGDYKRDYDPTNFSSRSPTDYTGVLYIYDSGSSGYTLTQEISASGITHFFEGFGWSPVLNSSGTKLFVSSLNDDANTLGGSVSVYESGSAGFEIVQELVPNDPDGSPEGDFFVYPLLSNDENTLFVGAYADESGSADRVGCVYVFQTGSSGWQQVQQIQGSGTAWGYFGYAQAINEDDSVYVATAYQDYYDQSEAGNYRTGTVVIHESGSSGWHEVQRIEAPAGDVNAYRFGRNISIRGSYLAVGSELDWRNSTEAAEGVDTGLGENWKNKGAVYIYERVDGIYVLKQRIVQEGSRNTYGTVDAQRAGFGRQTEFLPNNELLVSSPYDDKNGTNSGVVYKYKLTRDY